MRAHDELRLELTDLDSWLRSGLVTGQPLGGLVDGLDERMPKLRRLRNEAWLEHQARALRPRRPRITKEVWSRAARGDSEARALIEARYAKRKRGKQLELVQ